VRRVRSTHFDRHVFRVNHVMVTGAGAASPMFVISGGSGSAAPVAVHWLPPESVFSQVGRPAGVGPVFWLPATDPKTVLPPMFVYVCRREAAAAPPRVYVTCGVRTRGALRGTTAGGLHIVDQHVCTSRVVRDRDFIGRRSTCFISLGLCTQWWCALVKLGGAAPW